MQEGTSVIFYKGTFYYYLHTFFFISFHAISNVMIISINSMSQMPGIMSKMPPLPVSVDDRLASYILPGVNLVSFLLL